MFYGQKFSIYISISKKDTKIVYFYFLSFILKIPLSIKYARKNDDKYMCKFAIQEKNQHLVDSTFQLQEIAEIDYQVLYNTSGQVFVLQILLAMVRPFQATWSAFFPEVAEQMVHQGKHLRCYLRISK